MNAMFGHMEADEANKFRASIAPDVIKSLVPFWLRKRPKRPSLQFNKRRLNVHLA
jgi:hypothetical protein